MTSPKLLMSILMQNTLTICNRKEENQLVKDIFTLYGDMRKRQNGSEFAGQIFFVVTDPKRTEAVLHDSSLKETIKLIKMYSGIYNKLTTRTKFEEYEKDKQITVLDGKKMMDILNDQRVSVSEADCIIFTDIEKTNVTPCYQEVLEYLKKHREENPLTKLPRTIGLTSSFPTPAQKELLKDVFASTWFDQVASKITIHAGNELFHLSDKEEGAYFSFLTKLLTSEEGRTRFRDGEVNVDEPAHVIKSIRNVLSKGKKGLPSTMKAMNALILAAKKYEISEVLTTAVELRSVWKRAIERHSSGDPIEVVFGSQVFYVSKDCVFSKISILRDTIFSETFKTTPSGGYIIDREFTNPGLFVYYLEKDVIKWPVSLRECILLLEEAKKFRNPQLVQLIKNHLQEMNAYNQDNNATDMVSASSGNQRQNIPPTVGWTC